MAGTRWLSCGTRLFTKAAKKAANRGPLSGPHVFDKISARLVVSKGRPAAFPEPWRALSLEKSRPAPAAAKERGPPFPTGLLRALPSS